MIKCKVEEHYTALLVRFQDGKSLLIQDGTEQSDFVIDCGKEDWQDVDECPEVYYDVAEFEETGCLKTVLELIIYHIKEPKSLRTIAGTAESLYEKVMEKTPV